MARGIAMSCAAGAVAAGASTPSNLWWGVERIAVRCEAAPTASALADEICDTAVVELARQVSMPVVVADASRRARSSDLFLDIEVTLAPSNVGDRELRLAMRLRRPAGRSGDPVTRPERISTIELNRNGEPVGLPVAIARTLEDVLHAPGRRRQLPSPARAQ
jgi:hypothetical protein